MAWSKFTWVENVTKAIAARFNAEEEGIEEAKVSASEKLPIYNVANYSIKTGPTDQSAAIKTLIKTINEAGGGIMYFPPQGGELFYTMKNVVPLSGVWIWQAPGVSFRPPNNIATNNSVLEYGIFNKNEWVENVGSLGRLQIDLSHITVQTKNVKAINFSSCRHGHFAYIDIIGNEVIGAGEYTNERGEKVKQQGTEQGLIYFTPNGWETAAGKQLVPTDIRIDYATAEGAKFPGSGLVQFNACKDVSIGNMRSEGGITCRVETDWNGEPSPWAPTANTAIASSVINMTGSEGKGFITNARVFIEKLTAGVTGGLVEGNYYFVVGATANTFELAATEGGAGIKVEGHILETATTKFKPGLAAIEAVGVENLRVDSIICEKGQAALSTIPHENWIRGVHIGSATARGCSQWCVEAPNSLGSERDVTIEIGECNGTGAIETGGEEIGATGKSGGLFVSGGKYTMSYFSSPFYIGQLLVKNVTGKAVQVFPNLHIGGLTIEECGESAIVDVESVAAEQFPILNGNAARARIDRIKVLNCGARALVIGFLEQLDVGSFEASDNRGGSAKMEYGAEAWHKSTVNITDSIRVEGATKAPWRAGTEAAAMIVNDITEWHKLTNEATKIENGTTPQTPGVRLEGGGAARLRGTLKVKAAQEIIGTTDTVCTLPAGFRPKEAFEGVIAYNGTALHNIKISTGGVVTVGANAAAATVLYLEGITFNIT